MAIRIKTQNKLKNKLMSRLIVISFCSLFITFFSFGQRMYLVNSPGYNKADSILINAIANNGYTIDINDSLPYLIPSNFTSSCKDSVNGYEWLCFFGDYNYSGLLTQIESFIYDGGKVYYQYEVNCCDISSASVANLLSGLTGLTIVPDTNVWIALTSSGTGSGIGYEASVYSECDTLTVFGAAYKGLNGVPTQNQFTATENISNSLPSVTVCSNFGFKFSSMDFIDSKANGSIVGIGDYNVWYNGNEPSSIFAPLLLNSALVNFIFPPTDSSCSLYPRGCIPDCKLEMPNVFTPNNDNINDTFRPIEIECVNEEVLLIFNRWGVKVFESFDLLTGWDGNTNGNPCTDGTYYWIVEYTNTNNNEKKRLNGFVTLVR